MSRNNISYPESIEHIRIKEFLYENIPLVNQIKFINICYAGVISEIHGKIFLKCFLRKNMEI